MRESLRDRLPYAFHLLRLAWHGEGGGTSGLDRLAERLAALLRHYAGAGRSWSGPEG